MKKGKIIIAMLMLLLLIGCGKKETTAEDFESIDYDMTNEEIKDILGEPQHKIDNEVWTYYAKNKNGKEIEASISFNDGKVAFYDVVPKKEREDHDKKLEKSGKNTIDDSKNDISEKNDAFDDTILSDIEENGEVKSAKLEDTTIKITLKDQAGYSETQGVKNFAHYAAEVLEKTKGKDGFTDIVITSSSKMVNQKGNEKNTNVFVAHFKPEEVNKINFKNWKDIVVANPETFYNQAFAYWINLGVYKNIKEELKIKIDNSKIPEDEQNTVFHNTIG